MLTEQLAVGANDPYVRLYDRRMIKITSVQFNADRPPTHWGRQNILAANSRNEETRAAIPLGCVQYFAPGHLPRKLEEYHRRFRSLSSTYVTFDANGRHLLANLGGEQVYLYDCIQPTLPIVMPPSVSKAREESPPPLPAGVEQLKLQANAAFQQKQYTSAIGLYSRALVKAPKAAILYSNRAAAYMKRNWDGDVYAALKDCCTALKLDGGVQLKAFHRLVRCFTDVGLLTAAHETLKMLKEVFPTQSSSSAVRTVEQEIEKKLAAQRLLQQQRAAKKANSEVKEPQQDGEEEDGDSQSASNGSWPGCSSQENHWRGEYWDYIGRFAGHCNTTTDIKEANFFGEDGQYIMAGSDDGCFFVWDRATGIVERVLRGDESIVNCLQPHPFTCLLASSGIDSVVRLWSPLPQERPAQDRVGSVVHDAESASAANQRRMNADPFEMFLMNMGATADEGLPDIRPGRRARHPSPGGNEDDDEDGEGDDDPRAPIQCRPS